MVEQYEIIKNNAYLKGVALTNLNDYYNGNKSKNIKGIVDPYNDYIKILKSLASSAIFNTFSKNTIKIDLSKFTFTPIDDYTFKWSNYTESYETPQKEFSEALVLFTKALTEAQKSINEEIKNSIQVGGVNLIEFNKLENNGYLNFTKQRPKITVSYNKNDTKPAIQLPNNYSVIKSGYEYVLSYKFKKLNSGTYEISRIGIPLQNTECENVQIYIDNTLYPLIEGEDVGFTVNYSADTNEHKVVVKFKCISDVQDQYLIQFNRDKTTNFKVVVSDIQLEVGNVATEYKPNDADIIEARENILKGGMMVSLTTNTNVSKDLTTTLKKSTEYVFSVENSTNDCTLELFDEIYNSIVPSMFNVLKNKKNYITFTTSNFTNTISKVRLCTLDNNTTLYGIKLAEGNKYTPWEGSADEQKTLIMLNNAMNGTTETNGGLMLTNTIGMKGSSTDSNSITAGINGLNSQVGGVGGMSSDLRFWAGSTKWSDIGSAPFRVYNDGSVFGTNFYGYNGAVKITSSNKNNYITNVNDVEYIDLIKTGSVIFLDRSLLNIVQIESTNTYFNMTNVRLKFPDNIENYIGSTVTFINPFQILISNSAEINNIYNGNKIYNGKDCYNEYTGTATGIYSGEVQVLKENGTTYNYKPNFNIWHNQIGMTQANGHQMYGYKSLFAVQTFRLMSTPYLSSSSTINGYLKKIESSAIVINSVTYYRYGFWVLEDEIYNITKPYS